MPIGTTKSLIGPRTHRLKDADNRTIDHALVWIADFLPKCLLLHERREANKRPQEQTVMPRGGPEINRTIGTGTGRRITRPSHVGRQLLVSRVVIVHGQAKLLEIVAAAHPPSRFAGRLHGGQQQPHQHADDGDHDKKFHQGETLPVLRSSHNYISKKSKNKKEHTAWVAASMTTRQRMQIKMKSGIG
jgi:hypothetical protein